MMRYSWADIRPMIDQLGYSYDGYTANDINEIYLKLDRYDAIVIATNAYNDIKVRQSLDQHKNEISTFLDKKRGFVVLFQMKKDETEFFNYFPNEFQVKTVKRNEGENLKSGKISIHEENKNLAILSYPNKIDVKELNEHSLNNRHVKGLYWTYLVPENLEKYNIILEDNSSKVENRILLLSSREDLAFRIVISAIAIDWQGHMKLWENSIRYAVEGTTKVALITKEIVPNYDYRYFVSWLKVNKIPTKHYKNDIIPLSDIAFNIHSIYLIDPNFSIGEIRNFISAALPFINSGKAEVIFFDNNSLPKPFIATISNTRQFQMMSKNAIIWIKGLFPDDHGYFARSFWNTVDVLTTFSVFGEPTEQFKEKILNEIEKHDRGGCYDEVLGATCAMFEVYYFYLGLEHEKTLAALQWILENYNEKVLFEKASAIDVLKRFDCDVSEKEIEALRNEIIQFFNENTTLTKDNEFKLYRYCKTLFTCGFEKDAKAIALRFKDIQDKQDGKWVNISHTAAIIELLINIQDKTNSDIEIDEMIFKGIEYLYDNYDPKEFSWNNEVLATAKSLKTLKLFEDKVALPIDVIKNRILEEEKRINDFSAIELAARLNLKYIDEGNNLKKTLLDVKDQNLQITRGNEKFRKIVTLLLPTLLLVFAILTISVYLITKEKKWSRVTELFLTFIDENLGTIIVAVLTFILWIMILFMHEYNLFPQKTPVTIKKLIARIVPGSGYTIPEEKD